MILSIPVSETMGTGIGTMTWVWVQGTGTDESCMSRVTGTGMRPGPYFIKVKIILSLKFKINLIFYLIKESIKHSCLNFFYEIVNKINIKVKRN